MAEYTPEMRRAYERSLAEDRARMARLNAQIGRSKAPPAEQIYGDHVPRDSGRIVREAAIAAGKAKPRGR